MRVFLCLNVLIIDGGVDRRQQPYCALMDDSQPPLATGGALQFGSCDGADSIWVAGLYV